MVNLSSIDAVVLCGGLGKRLRSQIGATQKVMAEVGGRPFLDVLLGYLQNQGLSRVILCTGYQADSVERYYQEHDFGLQMEFSREQEPLGTGGAVKKAAPLVQSDPFFVLNGDSFCPIDYRQWVKDHQCNNALITIVVSYKQETKDYGSLCLSDSNRILAFEEKKRGDHAGYVNAGSYCFSKKAFEFMPSAKKFSLEEDFFPSILNQAVYGFKDCKHFFDIGTPVRYRQAQHSLRKAETT